MGRWRYTLKRGEDLRRAIYSEDRDAVLNTLLGAYHELWEAGIIDEDDCDEWSQEIIDLQDDIYNGDYDDPDEAVNYQLDQFWDLCDNLSVWVPLEADLHDRDVTSATDVRSKGTDITQQEIHDALRPAIKKLGGDVDIMATYQEYREAVKLLQKAIRHSARDIRDMKEVQ